MEKLAALEEARRVAVVARCGGDEQLGDRYVQLVRRKRDALLTLAASGDVDGMAFREKLYTKLVRIAALSRSLITATRVRAHTQVHAPCTPRLGVTTEAS